MKVTKHIPCCVCNEDAVERSFDGTGWCQIHYEDWKAFLRWNRIRYTGLSDAFDSWLEIAKEEQPECSSD